MRIRVEGDGKKPPLVFIHGAGGSATVWLDVFRHFERSRKVVAPDLPAHGQSEAWHDVSDADRVRHYADAVGTACAHLQIDRAVLVGHSMGGLVALAAAAAYPDKVAGLVLVASGPGLKPSEPLLAQLAIPEEQQPLFERMAWSTKTPREIVERWSKTVLSADPAVTLADFRACASFDAATVRQPTLLLGGKDDQLCSPRFLAKAATQVVGSQLELIADAGHFVHLEQPDLSIAAIERFLTFV